MSLIRSVAKSVFSEMGLTLSYKVGTMIEIPRAALVADEVRSNESLLHCFYFEINCSHVVPDSFCEWAHLCVLT